MESSPLKQVTDTQHEEELVATADTTKSVDASESVEVLGNYPKPADAEKVHEKIIEEEVEDPLATNYGISHWGIFHLKSSSSLRNKDANEESPVDNESEIRFIKKKVL
ncbi:hypothetical protein Tco_0355757 [Tanacetum coccineum]